MANKDWFGRKSLTLRSEEVFIKTATMAKLTLNTKRILTTDDLTGPPRLLTSNDLASFIDETLYSSMIGGPTPINLALTQITNFAPFTTPSVDGITLVAGTTVHITKKGTYQFYLQFITDIGATLWMQIRLNGVAYDGTQVTNPLLFTPSFSCHFVWSQDTDVANDFTFYVAGDSFPVAGTPPNYGALDLIINHRNKPIA